MGTTTIRPTMLSWTGASAAFILVLLVSFAVTNVREGATVVGGILSACQIAIGIGAVVWFFSGTRLTYGDGEYRLSRWGRTRTFRAADVRLAISVESLLGRGQITGIGTPRLIVMGTGRGPLFQLDGYAWRTSDLTGLADDLSARGVKVDAVGRIRLSRLTQLYPYSISFRERNWMFVVVVAIAVVFVTAWLLNAMLS